MRLRKLIPGPGIELWIATIGLGAFLLGGLVDIDRGGPRIGAVRLNDLTAEMVERTVQGEASGEEMAEAARVWAVGLEWALDRVAEREGVVLVPAEVVAAGALDYTRHVRQAMAAWESSIAGPEAAMTDIQGAGGPEAGP